MCQGAQFGKSEKAARALDRVDRAKDARQPLRIVGSFLQRHKILVELIEVFLALNQKFLDELFVSAHEVPTATRSTARRSATSHLSSVCLRL